ncbi:MAG TPA: ribonuclease H [Polyangiaceae bacterium]|nr:ribonuclease H [Polyangiaceae bacterium]
MPSFACQSCAKEFAVPEATLAKYPGWQPKLCLSCKKQSAPSTGKKAPAARARAARSSASSREENLSVAEVLAKYTSGPVDGVFTDGAAEPNPGPGGWGAVYVANNQIVGELWGNEPHTTNNRMELSALINGCALVPEGQKAVLYTDSQLCVSTINEWAKGWEARGWKRKGGEIKNLELVQELYAICKRRPELELRWIAAHSGNRWNEYADALATAYRRKVR